MVRMGTWERGGAVGSGGATGRRGATGRTARAAAVRSTGSEEGRLAPAVPRVATALLVAGLLVVGVPTPSVLVAQNGASPAGERIRIETLAGAREIPVARPAGFPAVRLSDLIGGFLTEATLAESGVAARLAGEPITLQVGSPFVRYGGTVYQLANPVTSDDGAHWVPSELLTHWWPVMRARRGTSVAAASAGPPPSPLSDGVWRVVIDPGHGGKDPGALGLRGTREKDVVLGIARRLHARLEREPGVEPVLTRDDDVFVPLRERSRFAVEREGELFVSIHANVADDRRAAGFETFFLSPARTERARRVAVRENAVMELEEGEKPPELGDIQFILAGLDRNVNMQESSRFAGYVQNSLRRYRDSADRGVKQAGFWVLLGALSRMPSVLVETGFISNGAEERVLRSERGQQRIADAIADAILEYRKYLERYDRVSAAGGR